VYFALQTEEEKCHERELERSAGHCTEGSASRLQNKGVSIPLIVAPVVILVAFPGLAALVSMSGDTATADAAGLDKMISAMPAGIQAGAGRLRHGPGLVVVLLVYMMRPCT